MKTLSFYGWIGVLFLFSACSPRLQPQESCNFVQNSELQRVSWKVDLPVVLSIDESVPPEQIPAIYRAIARWEYALGRSLFQVTGVSNSSTPKKDGVSTIYWLDKWTKKDTLEQARTTLYWSGNQILEADILFNHESYAFSPSDPGKNEVDFESVVVHELGHTLGLQHIDSVASVMASKLDYHTERREPSEADIQSISCEYR